MAQDLNNTLANLGPMVMLQEKCEAMLVIMLLKCSAWYAVCDCSSYI